VLQFAVNSSARKIIIKTFSSILYVLDSSFSFVIDSVELVCGSIFERSKLIGLIITTDEKLASERLASLKSTPTKIAPQRLALKRLTFEKLVSLTIAPERSACVRTASEKSAFDFRNPTNCIWPIFIMS
jgi:hypothetical protein